MKKLVILVILLLCSKCLAVPEPVYEFVNSADNNWITSRDSNIIDSNFTLLSVNAPRKQKVTSVPAVVPTISTRTTTPWGVDHVTYCPNDGLICLYNSGYILEETNDLVNYTTVCDLSTTKAVGDSNNITDYGYVQRMIVDNNAWWLFVGRIGKSYVPGTWRGVVLKSTDANHIVWNIVLHSDYAALLGNVCGSNVVAGEYHIAANDTLTVGRNIYLSTDYGASFVRIYNYEPFTGALTGGDNHYHTGYVWDANTVYVNYGDGSNAKTWKLTRPSPTWTGPAVYGNIGDTANWNRTELVRLYSGASMLRRGSKLYMAREEIQCFNEDVLVFDPTDDANVGATLHVPSDYGGTYFSPYFNSPIYNTYGLCVDDNDNLYVSFYRYYSASDSNCKEGTLAVSADCNNWTMLYRDPNSLGIKYLSGVMQINGTKYVTGQLEKVISGTGDAVYPIAVPIGGVHLNTGVCVQKGFTNNLARISATGNDDQWGYWDSVSYDGNSAQDSGVEGYGMKYWSVNHSGSPAGYYTGTTTLNSTYKYTNFPSTGDCITFGFQYRANLLFSAPSYDVSSSYNQYTRWYIAYGSQGLFTGVIDWSFIPISTAWRPYVTRNLCADGSQRTSTIRTFTRMQPTDLFRTGQSTIFDGLYLIYSDRWFENPAILDANCPSGTLIPGVVADEFVTLPVAVESKAWTLTFDWYPQSGYKDYPYFAAHPTLPICSILGTGGSYIDLNWNRSTCRFDLNDIDSSVSQTPTCTVNWRHIDCVKIAITCDGTNSNLYMWMPENNSVNGQSNGILTTAASGIGLTNIPISFRLGTNHSQSDIGNGCYANIRIFDSALSATDVAMVFNRTSPMKSLFNLAGDFTGDGRVEFEDLAILVDQWLQPPSNPSADLNSDGIVNFLDFAILAQHWLEGEN